jgi:hypothetical protein
LDPIKDHARPSEIDFNVDYGTVAWADSLFNWKLGPFVRTGL